MRERLKRFALSFFRDKYLRESAHCGFGIVLLNCVLAAVILFFGIFIGKNVLFSSAYNGASDFRGFVYGAFTDDDGLSLGIAVSDGKADVTLDGGHVVINTIENADDAQRFGGNGYHLIVDYNDMTEAYDDFSVVCTRKSDGSVIDYSDYRELSATEKGNYDVEVLYSGTRKHITADDTAVYETFLGANAAAELDAVKEKYEGDPRYAEELYALYVTTYYPDIEQKIGEEVPTLKKHYYDIIDKADGKYLCVFGDMLIGSFETDLGKGVSFGCVYTDFGLNAGDMSAKQARAAVDRFIKDLYYDNLSTLLFLEIMNGLIFLMAFLLTLILVTAACRIACAYKKIEIGSTVSCCIKTVGACVHVAALVAAVATVIFGLFRGGAAVTIFCIAAFAVTLVARLVVFYVREHAAQKKAASEADKADKPFAEYSYTDKEE